MNDANTRTDAAGGRTIEDAALGSAMPSAALADRCEATLDDLDKTGLGIGVERAHLDGLREDVTAHLARLASRRPGDLRDLRRLEGLVGRAMGFVDDWTAAFLQMMLRRHAHDMGLTALRRVRGARTAERASDRATLEGDVVASARKRRVAGSEESA